MGRRGEEEEGEWVEGLSSRDRLGPPGAAATATAVFAATGAADGHPASFSWLQLRKEELLTRARR